ncbi:MAG: phage tail protein [Dyella sp.]|uniref:phage tail protein n=1 Tax=Dyella sp. TaxID=1869338 RepID=UPI003F80DBF2
MSLFGGGHKSAAQTPSRALGLDLQGAQYGAPIPVVFGRNKLAGNVIDYFEFKAIAHTQKQQGGKGGGGGGQTSTSYTYSVSYLLGLHEGVGNVVNVYDGSSARSLSSVGGLAFTGAQGQAPWSHLSGDAALGYSGTVLVAFQNKDLGSSASLPNYNFEVDGRNQFSATIKDANPADIVTAICTDSQIGINFTALGDLTAFKDYCTAAGIFFSPVYDTQNPAQSTLEDLFKYSNSAPFFSEGQLKVVPYADETITGNGVTYTPSLTAVVDLGRDDFITNGTDDPVTVRRVAPADAMNIVRLEYKDRANTYHTSTAIASIDQDVVGTGSRADQSESGDMITDGAVARLVVQNLLQRGFYVRNEYDFQLPWRYCDLEPMDIVTLTDGNTGLFLTPVRIKEISEDENGLLQVTAEEFPEGVSHASIYATQPNAGTGVDPNADPGPITSPYLFRGPGFLVPSSQPEIWVAVSGVDPMWAGCDVYLSQDGTSYTYLTTHSRRAAYGETTNSLAAGSDPDTTGAPNVVLNGPVELLGGTMADADQFVTMAMIDNEIVAYQTATLAGGPSYTLGYLRRGGYGTVQAAHAAGAPFVRLDENILRIPVDPSQIGQTVYLKFVSFNVFGKGGRTLADETAYTYVVGTNIELPDVPVTPNTPAVTGVADGNSITWFNPNPAAVGCTSIEYSAASGGPWTVLAQVGPTSTSYVHHFTDGATYYYRLRSRGAVVSAGWSAYTAVISGKGTNVGAISSNATTAVGQVTQLPVINGGFDIAPTGYGWTADAGSGWTIDTAGNTPGVGPNSAKHAAGAGTGAYRNGGLAACLPGQVYKAQGLIKAVGANGNCYVYISWCDASGSEIGTTPGNTITGTTTAGSFAVGKAPSGTVFARTCLGVTGHTAGTYYVDNVLCSQYPSSQDEVPDGASYVRSVVMQGSAVVVPNANFEAPLAPDGTIPGWKAVGANISLSPTSYSGSQALYILTTSAGGGAVSQNFQCSAGDQIFAQIRAAASSGEVARIYIVFYGASGVTGTASATTTSASYQLIQASGTAPAGTAYFQIQLVGDNVSGYCYFDELQVVRKASLDDHVIDGSTYARIKGSELSSGIHRLGIVGSGARLGDLRNQVMVGVGNYASGWSGGSISYSASTTSATLSVSSATLQIGGQSLAYNASSTTVSGSAGSTVKYYLYYDDPSFTGGSKTLNATTSQITALSNDGRVLVGSVSVTYPTSGTGSGGGGTGCPDENAWVLCADPEGRRPDWCVLAREVEVGHLLRLTDGRAGRVTHSERKPAQRIRVFDENGATLTCSTSAPLELAGTSGECVLAPHSAGRQIKAIADGVQFDPIIWKVEPAGPGYVQHITCQNACFWTGDDPDYLFAHHNLKPGL